MERRIENFFSGAIANNSESARKEHKQNRNNPVRRSWLKQTPWHRANRPTRRTDRIHRQIRRDEIKSPTGTMSCARGDRDNARFEKAYVPKSIRRGNSEAAKRKGPKSKRTNWWQLVDRKQGSRWMSVGADIGIAVVVVPIRLFSAGWTRPVLSVLPGSRREREQFVSSQRKLFECSNSHETALAVACKPQQEPESRET